MGVRKEPAPSDFTTLIKKAPDDFFGMLSDPVSGKEYPLHEGRNLVGRMTFNAPPKADVAIVTDNQRMSRSHLNIDVIRGTDGRIHTYASNASNKNPTTINGVLLEDSDSLSLKDQDVLSLADTQLIFHGFSDHDETILL